MNDLHEDEAPKEYTTDTSSLEQLMIQAIINQLTDIVTTQNRANRIPYDKAFTQAETLRSLVQSALMLTDGESVHLHGGKIQSFLNRAVLEHVYQEEENE